MTALGPRGPVFKGANGRSAHRPANQLPPPARLGQSARPERGTRAAGLAGAWAAVRVRGAGVPGGPGRGARPRSRSGSGLSHPVRDSLCARLTLCGSRSAAAVSHVGSVRGAQRGGALRDALGPLVPDAGGGVHRGARPAGHPRQGRALRPAEPAHLPRRVRAGAAPGTARGGRARAPRGGRGAPRVTGLVRL